MHTVANGIWYHVANYIKNCMHWIRPRLLGWIVPYFLGPQLPAVYGVSIPDCLLNMDCVHPCLGLSTLGGRYKCVCVWGGGGTIKVDMYMYLNINGKCTQVSFKCHFLKGSGTTPNYRDNSPLGPLQTSKTTLQDPYNCTMGNCPGG